MIVLLWTDKQNRVWQKVEGIQFSIEVIECLYTHSNKTHSNKLLLLLLR